MTETSDPPIHPHEETKTSQPENNIRQHGRCTQPGCTGKATGVYTLNGRDVCDACYFKALPRGPFFC
jgi:hypothetical protein